MSSEATILHADLDAFFASVEQRDDPALRGRPIAVGGGVVLAASYEARAFGVRGAMGGREAQRLCPDLRFVRPRMEAYSEASKAVFAVFRDTTPFVEGISIDEAFLDVGGLRRIAGPPADIAAKLRVDVLDEVGLPITVGVARTKFLAKVASGVAKPDGLLVVSPDCERQFLHPLPVERMWGVGPKTAAKLHARGIDTIGNITLVSSETLSAVIGRAAGHHIHALANLRDPRRVQAGRRRRSIGSQRALGRSPKTPQSIDTALVGLVDRVMRRLRRADRVGRTVMLRLRFDDFTRATRSHTLHRSTADTDIVLTTARQLLDASLPQIRAQGLTLVGITIANLDDDTAVQLELPFHRRHTLDAVLDDVKERYGSDAITRAVLVGRDPGISMPEFDPGALPVDR